MSVRYTKFQLQVLEKFGFVPVFTDGNPQVTQLNKRVENENFHAWCMRVIGLPSSHVKIFTLSECSAQTSVENIVEKNIELHNVFNTKVKQVKVSAKRIEARKEKAINPSIERVSPSLIADTMRTAVLFMPPLMEEFIESFVSEQKQDLNWPSVFESLFEKYIVLANHTIKADSSIATENVEDSAAEEFSFDFSFDMNSKPKVTEADVKDINHLITVLSTEPEALTLMDIIKDHSKSEDFIQDYGSAAKKLIWLDDLEQYVIKVGQAFSTISFVDFSSICDSFEYVLKDIEDLKDEDFFPPASELEDPAVDRTHEEKSYLGSYRFYLDDITYSINETFRDIFYLCDNIIDYQDLDAQEDLISAVIAIKKASETAYKHMLDISNFLMEVKFFRLQ